MAEAWAEGHATSLHISSEPVWAAFAGKHLKGALPTYLTSPQAYNSTKVLHFDDISAGFGGFASADNFQKCATLPDQSWMIYNAFFAQSHIISLRTGL